MIDEPAGEAWTCGSRPHGDQRGHHVPPGDHHLGGRRSLPWRCRRRRVRGRSPPIPSRVCCSTPPTRTPTCPQTWTCRRSRPPGATTGLTTARTRTSCHPTRISPSPTAGVHACFGDLRASSPATVSPRSAGRVGRDRRRSHGFPGEGGAGRRCPPDPRMSADRAVVTTASTRPPWHRCRMFAHRSG